MLDKSLKNSSWTKLNICPSFSGEIICTCFWCLGTLSSNCRSRDTGSWHNLLCTPQCPQSSTCNCSIRWRMEAFGSQGSYCHQTTSLPHKCSCCSLSLSPKWPKQHDWLWELPMIVNIKNSLVHSNLIGYEFSPYEREMREF